MKKLIATLLVAMIAFAAFAGIAFTVDTFAQYAGPNDPAQDKEHVPQGFSIRGADEDIFADMNAALTKGPVNASLNVRFTMPDEKYSGAPVKIHGWDITSRITSWLKLSVGNTPYELFAEGISWEPIGGAGLFEQGRNRLYFDMQFDDFQVIAGVSMNGSAEDFSPDLKKPWKTLQAAVVYDIPLTVKLAAEFSMVSKLMSVSTDYDDGDVKSFSFQANYVGVENLDVVAGYTLIMAESAVVQHRADLFASYVAEQFEVQLYDAFLLRLVEGAGNGNRLGFKFSYYATETLTPYITANWFKNYGYPAGAGGYAWGDCQIYGPGAEKSLIVIDAGLGFTISDNLSGTVGGVLKFVKDSDMFWSIPLRLTATF